MYAAIFFSPVESVEALTGHWRIQNRKTAAFLQAKLQHLPADSLKEKL